MTSTRPASVRGETDRARRVDLRRPEHVPAVTLVTLFTKADCHLCEEALSVLEEVRAELPFELEVRDIRFEEELHRAYFERIPVVSVDGEELFEFFVDAELLRERLESRRWPSRN